VVIARGCYGVVVLALPGLAAPGYAATVKRMSLPDGIDVEKLAEVALALLSLSSFTDHGTPRAWKGLDWDVLDLLHQRGWIENPKGRARSVVFTDLGRRLAGESLAKHFQKV
jgi:hypothetical protein